MRKTNLIRGLFFFVGAFIMLDKSLRVNCAIAVTPVKIGEYIFSKIVSRLVTGTLVGGILCLYTQPRYIFSNIPAFMAASALFYILLLKLE